MSADDRREIGELLGRILGCINHIPDVPQWTIDQLSDAVSRFMLKAMPKEKPE